MTREEASERIRMLRNVIRYHDKLYYRQCAPIISDYKYDMFYAELVSLERQYPEFASTDSPTQRVGS